MAREPLQPKKETCLAWFHFCEWFVNVLFPVSDIPEHETYEDWLKTRRSSVKKRVAFARREACYRPHDHTNGAFVKCETRASCPAENKSRIVSDVDPARTDRCGRFFYTVSKFIRMFRTWGFAYYLSYSETRDALAEHAGLWSFYDFSTFDLSLSRIAFDIERLLWKQFHFPESVISSIYHEETHWQARTRCNPGEFPFAFSVKGRCRQSGDPQTSIANNFLGVCAHSFVYVESYRRSHNLRSDWYKSVPWVRDLQWMSLLENGDDSAIIWHHDPPDMSIYSEIGLKIKHSSAFCKMHLLKVGPTKYTLVRELGEFLIRFGFSTKNVPDRLCREHLKGIAIGYSYITSGVPMCSALVSAVWRLSRSSPKFDLASMSGHSLIGFVPVLNPGFQEQQPVTDAARLSFFDLFGICPIRQLEFEEVCQGLSDPYCIISIPWLNDYLWRFATEE